MGDGSSDPMAAMVSRLRDGVPRLSQLGLPVASELDDLLARSLERDPDARPSAAELAKGLAAVAATGRRTGRTSVPGRTISRVPASRPGGAAGDVWGDQAIASGARSRAVVVAASAGAAALLALGALWLVPSRSPERQPSPPPVCVLERPIAARLPLPSIAELTASAGSIRVWLAGPAPEGARVTVRARSGGPPIERPIAAGARRADVQGLRPATSYRVVLSGNGQSREADAGTLASLGRSGGVLLWPASGRLRARNLKCVRVAERVWAAWTVQKGRGQQVWFCESKDAGVSWSANVALSPPGINVGGVDLVAAGDAAHVIWTDDIAPPAASRFQVWHRARSAGGSSWTTAAALADVSALAECKLVAESPERVLLLYHDAGETPRASVVWATESRIPAGTPQRTAHGFVFLKRVVVDDRMVYAVQLHRVSGPPERNVLSFMAAPTPLTDAWGSWTTLIGDGDDQSSTYDYDLAAAGGLVVAAGVTGVKTARVRVSRDRGRTFTDIAAPGWGRGRPQKLAVAVGADRLYLCLYLEWWVVDVPPLLEASLEVYERDAAGAWRVVGQFPVPALSSREVSDIHVLPVSGRLLVLSELRMEGIAVFAAR
jgi:hypothetical protein